MQALVVPDDGHVTLLYYRSISNFRFPVGASTNATQPVSMG